MKKILIKNYARLLAEKGINVKKGDTVRIIADLDQPEFVKAVTAECYKLGAKSVDVEWDYQPLTKTQVKYRSLKTMSTVLPWEEERFKYRAETLPSVLYIESSDPDGLKGVNQEKISKSRQAKYKITKKYQDQMENKYKWCIASVPGKAWAKKVFPSLPKNKAEQKLWEAILYTSRADGEDPVKSWDEHNADLKKRFEYLNSLKIKELHYSSSNGTNLRVGLIEDGLFAGGEEITVTGENFNPNIPSEEVFTSPKKGLCEGVAVATKPLSYRGEIIENFSIRFEKGKAVEVHAEKNEELLKTIISMDENAGYLGECALVPFDSPIRNSEITFFNTLFDENACCHLALGEGFTNLIKDYDKYSLKELREKGINDSIIHVDFMIGSKDLNIEALTFSGKKVQIFKDGNWAF